MNEVLNALYNARNGKVYDLAHELGRNMPSMDRDTIMPFTLTTYRSPEDMGARNPGMRGVTFHVDMVQGSFHCGTHIDALVHCQYGGKIHGGSAMGEARGDFGWSEQGAETIPPIVTRGIMLDIAGLHGVPILPDGYRVGIGDLENALDLQQMVLEPGDTVLIRTGKARQFTEDPEAFVKGCPGIARDAAEWLADRGMANLAVDSTSADPQPEDWSDPAHVLLLVKRGIYILENVNMEELGRDRVHEFLFVCLPLKVTGATGSWIRPIAIA